MNSERRERARIDLSNFGISVPIGYIWLIRQDIMGFDPDSRLEPWFLLESSESFDVTERWPNGPLDNTLISFARRYDCDDIACFEVCDRRVCSIVVIQGWYDGSYLVLNTYNTFWDWIKSVIDDIAQILEP